MIKALPKKEGFFNKKRGELPPLLEPSPLSCFGH